jgi:hypothetical protein
LRSFVFNYINFKEDHFLNPPLLPCRKSKLFEREKLRMVIVSTGPEIDMQTTEVSDHLTTASWW